MADDTGSPDLTEQTPPPEAEGAASPEIDQELPAEVKAAIEGLREAELPNEPVQVDIRDEASQFQFDQNLVVDTLRERRVALAQAKLEYQLSKGGLLEGGGHPESAKKRVKLISRQIEWLIEQANSKEPIPNPTELEVATVVPTGGEAQKLGLA